MYGYIALHLNNTFGGGVLGTRTTDGTGGRFCFVNDGEDGLLMGIAVEVELLELLEEFGAVGFVEVKLLFAKVVELLLVISVDSDDAVGGNLNCMVLKIEFSLIKVFLTVEIFDEEGDVVLVVGCDVMLLTN